MNCAPVTTLLHAALALSAPPAHVAIDTGLVQDYKGEIRAGVTLLDASRVSIEDGYSNARTTGTLRGGELLARITNIGVYARTLSGSFSDGGQGIAGDFVLRDVRLLLGDRIFSVEGGLVQRTTSTQDVKRDQKMWRGGIRSQWEIGGSGVQVTLDAAVRFGNLTPDDSTTASFHFLGVEGEGALLLQAPHDLPIYAMAGWHYERFDDAWGTVARYQELSGPFLSIGVRFAGKPVMR